MKTTNYIVIFLIAFITFGCDKSSVKCTDNKEGDVMKINESIKCTINTTAEKNNVIKLKLVFENITDSTVYIPKRLIFVDDYPSDVARCLSINCGKENVACTGPLITWRPEVYYDYYEFLPHSKVTQVLKLNDFFDISKVGKYEVVYSVLVLSKDSSGSSVSFRVESNVAEFNIE